MKTVQKMDRPTLTTTTLTLILITKNLTAIIKLQLLEGGEEEAEAKQAL
jgi:hypothetical protein